MQMCLYDFLSDQVDPLLESVQRLKVDEVVKIGDLEVTYTRFGLYELSSDGFHDAFGNARDVYYAIQEFHYEKEG